MSALARFQDDFLRAVYDVPVSDMPVSDVPAADAPIMPPLDAQIAAMAAQPGFAVYRNTILKGCVDALQANFPSVARLVGDDWFRAAATIHARASRPAGASLIEYGADFPDFLARFAPARELDYLPGVAALDRCWTEAHVACDEVPLDAAALAHVPAAALGDGVLRPLAAARWRWFDALPVYTIWRLNREARAPEQPAWHGEGALLVRQGGEVRWFGIGRGACAFLDACAAGMPLAGAADAALQAEPALDVAAMLAMLLINGVFAAGHDSFPFVS